MTPSDQNSPDGAAAVRRRQLRRPVPSRRLSRVHGQRPPSQSGTVEPAGDPAPPEDRAGPPMGVLIGGSVGRGPVPGSGPGGQACARRVAVELVRLGDGTTQVVLPEWRPAIAVSIPTERLLAETGVDREGLAATRLSVLINPEALHDRELDPREWRAEPPTGRTRRRTGA
ncbi:hypothetical protein ACGFX4_37570 [Kitasatospora sp. NPDC048365]|uniref:hypothetical protein n=1 Tax=Kitasatospora sp. NPDC048365 TaxID=3364050 RepID=UPI003710552C